MWVNLSDYYPPGSCYNFSVYLVHMGGDLLVEGIPFCVDSNAVSNWDEKEGGSPAPTAQGCNDTADNDLDTHPDCADSNCDGRVGGINCTGGQAYCIYGSENNTADRSTCTTCYDCFDNDADSLTDCQDLDCDQMRGDYADLTSICEPRYG
jgi:hypothetical protein